MSTLYRFWLYNVERLLLAEPLSLLYLKFCAATDVSKIFLHKTVEMLSWKTDSEELHNIITEWLIYVIAKLTLYKLIMHCSYCIESYSAFLYAFYATKDRIGIEP